MNVGGPAMEVAALHRGLPTDRFECRLVAGSVSDGEADHFDFQSRSGGSDLDVVQLPGLGRAPSPVDDARAMAGLIRQIRLFRPHLVHTHTAKAGALGRVAARRCGVGATVHTFHGHLLHGYFPPLATKAVVAAERALAPSTTRLVAVGERVRDELLAAGIGEPGQYRVIAPGSDLGPGPDQALARRLLELPDEGPVLAWVARLAPVKRIDRFVTMARLLAMRDPTIHFLVAGDGPMLQSAMALARPLGDSITFLRWRADVETVYAAADVVVLTSDNEGMPLSLIEAARAGRAAVTTNAGSAPEVVVDGETGLVTGCSARALANSVERLLGDDEFRRRLGEAAAKRAGQEFTTKRLVGDIASLYEEAAAAGARR